jgi:hypothetical protein
MRICPTCLHMSVLIGVAGLAKTAQRVLSVHSFEVEVTI